MTIPSTTKNNYHLKGSLAFEGYDWWWHSFSGHHKKTKQTRSFFIEYFVINPAHSQGEVIFGQLKQDKPSYVMVKAGCWGTNAKQLHRFFAHNTVSIKSDKLELCSDDCYLSETKMTGSVNVLEQDAIDHTEYMSDAGTMTWDLQILKKIAYDVGYGTSTPFRVLNAFEMYWHAQGMKTEYTGTLTMDGEEYEINADTSYGYADKNWGRDFTSPWVWISSCRIYSDAQQKMLDNTVFNIGGGCPKVFGIALKRKLLFVLNYEGTIIEFNFSKFWKKSKIDFNCYTQDNQMIWDITAENRTHYIELQCICNKEEMLCINYESPKGLKEFSELWNGGTGRGHIALYKKVKNKTIKVDTLSFSNAGCEYGEFDTN